MQGVIIFLASILTNALWGIDIDIFGAFVFIVGLIACFIPEQQRKRKFLPTDKIGIIATCLGFITAILSLITEQSFVVLLGAISFILAAISFWKHKEKAVLMYVPLLVGGFLSLTKLIELVQIMFGITP